MKKLITYVLMSLTLIGWQSATGDASSAQGHFDQVFGSHKGKLGYDRFRSEFLQALEKQTNHRRNKALAVARDIGGRWVYGTSQGERTKSEAKQSAMANCKKFRNEFTVDAPCKLYQVNSKVVLKSY